MKFLEAVDLPLAVKYRRALFMHPRYVPPTAWLGHIPFAFFLIAMMEPKKIVELGTFLGSSYFAFCQVVKEFKLNTECHAIDTWEGDKHVGEVTDEFYHSVVRANSVYKEFSYLNRMTFDEASELPDLDNIDLCHIDGFHTYEAVKHDFDTWLPKMSEQGVMLFHDISEMKDDFGVWRFWSEVSREYPSCSFDHSHGLGVLLVGKKVKKDVRRFANSKHFNSYEQLFRSVGAST